MTVNGDIKTQPTAVAIVEERKTNYNLYIAAFTADLLSLTCGITFSWTSPVFPKLSGLIDPQLNPLGQATTNTEEGWIANLNGLGAIFGPIIVGKLSDKIGRKKTLLLAALPLMISFFMLAFAEELYLYYIARFLSGLSVGGCFVLLPIFLGEIAEDHNRGELGCLMSVFCSSGILFSFIVGPYLSITMFSLSCTIPLWFFIIVFAVFTPESPVYFIYKNDKENAEKSLKKLRNYSDKNLQEELDKLVKYAEEVKTGESGFFKMFKSRALVKGLVITLGLVLCQQLSGIAIVLAFMQPILQAAGDRLPADICVIVIGAIQVLVTIITSSIVERSGRKILLLISTVGSGLSLVALGCYFYLKEIQYDMESVFWLPFASLIFFIVSFNIGLGPLPWAIISEIFPTNVKAFATMLTTSVAFFAVFAVQYCFSILVEVLGLGICFLIFAGFCVFCILFIYLYVLETRGKSLLEIQEILNRTGKN